MELCDMLRLTFSKLYIQYDTKNLNNFLLHSCMFVIFFIFTPNVLFPSSLVKMLLLLIIEMRKCNQLLQNCWKKPIILLTHIAMMCS